jgi:hypothetical protein
MVTRICELFRRNGATSSVRATHLPLIPANAVGGNCIAEREICRALRLCLFIVVLGVFCHSAEGQSVFNAQDAKRVNELLDQGTKNRRMPCSIDRWSPFLDFSFRYDVTFELRCRVGKLDAQNALFVRITPDTGNPVLLGKFCTLPPNFGTPAGITEIGCEGGFRISQGTYRIEAVAIDTRGRSCKRQWRVSVKLPPVSPAVLQSLSEHKIQTWNIPHWNGKLVTRDKGLRVTVFFHAAPTNPKRMEFSGWDGVFLMQSLASLLEQLPCASVRLVAFNLEQQREIFRRDGLDEKGFLKLSDSLENLRFGSIAGHTSQGEPGWLEFLAGLINKEVAAAEPSDLAIFLGPASHLTRQVRQETPELKGKSNPQFCYFQYMPYYFWYVPAEMRSKDEFADSIQRLTRTRGGTVFKIHSPPEFGQAIQKMLKQVKPREHQGATLGD